MPGISAVSLLNLLDIYSECPKNGGISCFAVFPLLYKESLSLLRREVGVVKNLNFP